MTALVSHIMEVMEPEHSLYYTMEQRCIDIPKYSCNLS